MTNNQVQLKDKNNNKCYPNPYWPVGSIFLSMNDTNPSTYFGGTWQLIGQGRTLVGVNTSDSALNTSNKTGGSTNPLSFHGHGQYTSNNGGKQPFTLANGGGPTNMAGYWHSAPNAYTGPQVMTTYEGDNTNHNNWQPFLTCYIWNRIS